MAGTKKRKKTVKKTLKYEVYGILFLIFSVITLASSGTDGGVGSVGRSLGAICYFLAGRLPYVIPLVFIYIGLYVMIYRAWPKKWTHRRSGLLLAVIAILITYQMNLFHQYGEPYTAGDIIGHPIEKFGEVMRLEIDQATFREHAGGGLIGALSYGVLYFLFADLGASLMVIALFAISFVYITGITYTDMIKSLRRRMGEFRKVIRMRWRESSKARKAKRNGKDTGLRDDDEEDDDPVMPALIDEETYNPYRKRKKKSAFMELLFPKEDRRKTEDDDVRDRDEDEDDVDDDEDVNGQEYAGVMMRSADVRRADGEHAGNDEDTEEHVIIRFGDAEKEHEPVFRDFQERVKRRLISEDDERELEEAADRLAELEEREERGQHFRDARHVSTIYGAGYDEEEGLKNGLSVPNDAAADLETGTGGTVEGAQLEGKPSETARRQPDIRIQITPPPVRVKEPKPYQLPPFSLLNKPGSSVGKGGQTDYKANARKLEATLESFGVRAKVVEVVRGPAVTRYEIQPDIGVKVSRIVGLTDDIALALAARDIRMEAPIPGKSAIGIEIPNDEISVVTLREVMESPAFLESTSRLSIALGRDISGQAIVANLARMPHLLVAGATGSGKSVCINGIITSILYKAKPSEVKLLLVDPKMVELSVYNGIPHLLSPVVTDPRRASLALKKIVAEMEKRYEMFSKAGIRNIEGYNAWIEEKIASGDHSQSPLPYIVVIVDELADLMMVAAGDVEESITRIAQKARAAGIHLILATQRPSVDVITGVIKANIPSRIAFGVSSQVDSRTILDCAGAEKLLGRGDMLFLPVGAAKPIRIQGAFLSDQEVEAVCEFVRKQEEADYRTDIVPEVDESQDISQDQEDELFDQAVQIVIEAKQASVSLLQRRMRIGYTRAARLIDAMEAKGIVGPYEGSKPREVLMTMEQYEQRRISS